MKTIVTVNNSNVYEPIADGALSIPFAADGRLIPVVILDTSSDTTLSDLIELHDDSCPGDVESFWGRKRFSKKNIFLTLNFQRPVEFQLIVKFDLSKSPLLIDCIIQSRAVYIQPGCPGARVSNDINAPKILVEIPTRTTFDEWDSILEEQIKKRLKKEGVSSKEIKKAVWEYISVRRDTWGPRI